MSNSPYDLDHVGDMRNFEWKPSAKWKAKRGEANPVDEWLLRENKELKEKLIKYEQDYRDMATEFRVITPAPGTDVARLMLIAKSARCRAIESDDETRKLLLEIDKLEAIIGME